jgi:hypothetical protein
MPALASIARLAAAAAAVTLSVAACSSAGDAGGEQTAAIEPALLAQKCLPGYVRDCSGDGPNGQVICTCIPDGVTIDAETSAPTAPAGTDICGASDVAVPSFLAYAGCTLGTVVDGQPVWACPTSKVPSNLPNALGLITVPTQGPCYASNGTQNTLDPSAAPCEIVVATPSITSNSCVGPLKDPVGWTFVIDALADVRPNPPTVYCHYPWGIAPCKYPVPGGCAGGCPVPPKVVGP